MEIKKLINIDVGIVFFVPAIVGSIFGYIVLWFILINENLGNMCIYSLGIIPIFFFLQATNYYIASRKYSDKVIRKLYLR